MPEYKPDKMIFHPDLFKRILESCPKDQCVLCGKKTKERSKFGECDKCKGKITEIDENS